MKNYLSIPQNRLRFIQEIEMSLLMLFACCYTYLQTPISPNSWLILTFAATVFAPFILPNLFKGFEFLLLTFFKFLNILSKGSGELLTLFYKKGLEEFVEKHNNFVINYGIKAEKA